MEAGRETVLLCLGTESQTLRQTKSRESLWVEMTPLRDVRIVMQHSWLVRPLQRIGLSTSKPIQTTLTFISLEAKVEVKTTNNEVLNKSFVLHITHD